jgi:hypothetical protein
MADVEELSNALHDALAADATLIAALSAVTAIYESLAKKGVALPYCIYSFQGGGDENLIPSRMLNEVWLVKGVARSLSVSKTIATAIDAVLHDQTLTVSGWTNFWTARESPIRYVEVDDDGKPTYHRGGLYRIRLSD